MSKLQALLDYWIVEDGTLAPPAVGDELRAQVELLVWASDLQPEPLGR